MELARPQGRQREVLALPVEGHTVVLGTAGSGKTTLAVLRAEFLADPDLPGSGRVLLVTFNTALATFLRHLRRSRKVRVEHYHKFARGYLASRGRLPRVGRVIADPGPRGRAIEAALEAVRERAEPSAVLERDPRFFSDELAWISRHGISTEEEYRDVERMGRASARLARKDRGLVWAVREAYLEEREARGRWFDWDDLASAVREELEQDDEERRYRHIVIDEGQDFSPEMLRSLVQAVPEDGSVTFFGDYAQQIYGSRMSWRDAGFEISRDGVWEFVDNYRNTKEIARLALAMTEMEHFEQPEELLVEPLEPAADGPKPTVLSFGSDEEELEEVARLTSRAARRGGSVAVLYRDRVRDEMLVQPHLPTRRVRLHRSMGRWPSGGGVFHGTYHAAKGLEFDTVILPFCSASRLPDPSDAEAVGYDEAASNDGKALYVGVTRAKANLIITHTGLMTPLLPSEPDLYTSPGS